MQVTLLDTARVEAEWPTLAERLWRAVKVDPAYDLADLKYRILSGSALLFEVSDGAHGLWVVSIRDEGELVAWTTAVVGEIHGGPKERVAKIRHAVAALEKAMRLAGVKAHRVCGRDWSRVLTDYEPYKGDEFGLEKRLG